VLVAPENLSKDAKFLFLTMKKFWCETKGQWQLTCSNCRKRKRCSIYKERKQMAKTQVKAPIDEIAGDSKEKQLKILITGPRGQYKTRSILWMCDNSHTVGNQPILSIIDTENGTDHYGGQFRFRRVRTSDPDEINAFVEAKSNKPDGVEVLALDSHTNHFNAVKSKYADLYLKRMPTSAGHKQEFYIFQPNDHMPYQKEIYDLLRNFIKSPFHFIWTCHSANKWSGMKVVGEKPDGVKGLEHWFDTVIHIYEKANGAFVAVIEKDRTGTLVEKTRYPWRNQDDAFALFKPFRDIIHGTVVENLPAEKLRTVTPSPATITKEEMATAKTAEDKSKPKAGPEAPTDSEEAQKADLMEIVRLKKELRIIAREDWEKLLKPYRVPTAKEMTAEQRKKFIAELEALRPTEAQAA